MAASPQVSKVIGIRNPNIEYEERLAVRTIVKDSAARVILIFVNKGQYYKVPGAGIEGNEDHALAAAREVLEETGCKVETSGKCLAVAEEWRNELHQFSFCYVADVLEDTGAPEPTELEQSEGLKHGWYAMSDAFSLIKASQPTSELGRYIKESDLFFMKQFEEAKSKPSVSFSGMS